MGIRQGEVEIEGLFPVQCRYHGAKTPLLGNLAGHDPIARLGLDETHAELAPRARHHVLQLGLDRVAVGAQGVGQHGICGNIGDKFDRLVDTFEQAAAHLVVVQHALDGPGDIVFRVAQQHIGAGVGRRAHLDQLIEIQGFVLAAILHQDIEIGTDQCRLVAIRYLEWRGLDAVALIGFLLQLRVLGGVD